MAGNTREIKTRLTVEGEKQLRNALSENGAEAKRLGSEMNLLTAEFEDNTDSQEYLAKKGEILAAQVENAQKKVALYQQKLKDAQAAQAAMSEEVERTRERLQDQEKALEAAIADYGEGSDRVMELRNSIADGNVVLQCQEEKLSKANRAVEQMAANVNNAQTNLVKMSKAANNNEKSLQDMGDAVSGATGKGKLLDAAMKDLSGRFGIDLPDSAKIALGSIETTATGIGLAVGAVTAAVKASMDAAKAWVDMALEQSEWANELKKQSAQMGIDVERFQALTYAASVYGVEADKLVDSNKDLTQSLADATEKGSEEAKAFRRLGINIYDTNGNIRASGEVWEELIQKLGRMNDATEIARYGNMLMGESYYDLMPIFEDVNGFYREVNGANKENIALNSESVEMVNKVRTSYLGLEAQVEAIKRALTAQSAEDLVQALNRLNDVVQEIGGYLIDSGAGVAIGKMIEYAVAQLELMSTFLDLPGLKSFFNVVSFGLDMMTRGLDTVSKFVDKIASGISRTKEALLGPWGGSGSNNTTAAKGHAAGTPYFEGGETLVGEYGPERVILPRGSKIVNAPMTAAQTGGDTYITLNVSVPNLETLQKIIEFYENYQLTRRKM